MSSSLATAAPTEAAQRADFTSIIRYGQCWEDADVLLEALDVQRGDICISIASAGENSLSLLTRSPARVIAIDLNPSQLACVALRVAAFRRLDHPGLLKLIGSVECDPAERMTLYRQCRTNLDDNVRTFWDARADLIRNGIGSAGKFERYFATFRRWMLPLVHSNKTVRALLQPRTLEQRREFYRDRWDTWRWRMLFSVFFSRFVMGRLGRDPALFEYVEGSVADRIRARAEHALMELDPSTNPYLRWILTEHHAPEALPHALRPQNFEAIRANLDRLELRCASIEQTLDTLPPRSVDRFNLSDIFEYMSEENFTELVAQIIASGKRGARLAYWNMLVPRSRPEQFTEPLESLEELSRRLHEADKAFFYSRFIVEELR